ncbi:4278_t:CDS:2 [Funneliformis caledonium]|uniref:4278_t:CDS:1 n=1 Tax=Funneliformis caledonium TaxID=1117310 RepID=A0A9N8ZVP4_9GLOM|nr:4278_t:CDS:2 [Funneliformis caledonium]
MDHTIVKGIIMAIILLDLKAFPNIHQLQNTAHLPAFEEGNLVKKLDAIFEADYTEIESKIISEIIINGDNQTEKARLNFFIKDALLDFIASFRMLRVLDHKISERTYIVEFFSPIFCAF